MYTYKAIKHKHHYQKKHYKPKNEELIKSIAKDLYDFDENIEFLDNKEFIFDDSKGKSINLSGKNDKKKVKKPKIPQNVKEFIGDQNTIILTTENVTTLYNTQKKHADRLESSFNNVRFIASGVNIYDQFPYVKLLVINGAKLVLEYSLYIRNAILADKEIIDIEGFKKIKKCADDFIINFQMDEKMKNVTNLADFIKNKKVYYPPEKKKMLMNLLMCKRHLLKIWFFSNIRLFTKLRALVLIDCDIDDNIKFPSNNRLLSILVLTNGNITKTSFLSDLSRLQILNLSNNKIKELELKRNIMISSLNLSNNMIKDISSLKEMKKIKELRLGFNQIGPMYSEGGILPKSGILPLYGMKDILVILNLRNNLIKDISPLREMKKIEKLYLGHNFIRDISQLKGILSLVVLDLEDNIIEDISPLREMKKIKHLYLGSNRIKDISYLKNLINITTLNLQKNLIRDISYLKNLINITTLYLDNNLIKDISHLKNMINITILYLGNNLIRDISYLREMKRMEHLNLNNNKIVNFDDFGYLMGMKQMISLDFGNNGNIEKVDLLFMFNMRKLKVIYFGFPKRDITAYERRLFLGALRKLSLAMYGSKEHNLMINFKNYRKYGEIVRDEFNLFISKTGNVFDWNYKIIFTEEVDIKLESLLEKVIVRHRVREVHIRPLIEEIINYMQTKMNYRGYKKPWQGKYILVFNTFRTNRFELTSEKTQRQFNQTVKRGSLLKNIKIIKVPMFFTGLITEKKNLKKK